MDWMALSAALWRLSLAASSLCLLSSSNDTVALKVMDLQLALSAAAVSNSRVTPQEVVLEGVFVPESGPALLA
jgi:hypothetical protein